jgi:sulfite exporter TauE/SafE
VTSSGALNGTVVVRPCITAVAVPVAVSTPFTSVTLVIVGIMLMLVGFGAATASGSPLVITSTDSATKAETILFFVLIIVPPLFNFRFYF